MNGSGLLEEASNETHFLLQFHYSVHNDIRNDAGGMMIVRRISLQSLH